jgi:protein-S-isoprenylcysteine O-methyltransferase Ste14
MYGFPLTIYLLTRFFNLDRTSLHSNLWSELLGYGDTGMMVAMLAGLPLIILGLAMLTTGWREVYRARRQGRMATDGIYGIVRNPQYTGIFLALFGEGVLHWPTIISVALYPVIVISYVLLARSEERQMIGKFGEQYAEYRRHVPMFFPRWGQWRNLAGQQVRTS